MTEAMGWVRDFYRDKVLLVTGATGFLGKALVEKVLRALPEIRRLYLLVRGKRLPNGAWLSAQERVQQELLRSAIFTTLRHRYQDAFDALIAEKVVVLEGDLVSDDLGLDPSTYDQVARDTDILINSAAIVAFDERLDRALTMNALGVRRLLRFAHRGKALRAAMGFPPPLFAHISTCYVCGIRDGIIPEEAPDPNGVEEEIAELWQLCRTVEEQVGEDEAPPIRERAFREAIVEEGMRRAKERGFNDTYTYTKWLGERLLAAECGDLPTLILRPAIIESTLREPEPGWIENQRMADPLIIGFAKRQLTDFPGDPDCVVDLIPCDFVVNAVFAAIAALGQGLWSPNQGTTGTKPLVIQIATSTQNLLTLKDVVKWCVEYFERQPLLDRDGRPLKVKPWTLPSLQRYQQGLRRQKFWVERQERLAQWFAFLPFARAWQRRLSVIKGAIERLEYFVSIYAPYTHMRAQFATENLQRLWSLMTEDDRRTFPFDVTTIDWRHYLQEVHIPGLKRHILRIAEDNGASEHIRTLPDLLAHAAARFPDKVALQHKRRNGWVRYTYRQLWQLAQANAYRLFRLGVRRGDRVIVCGDNCPEWVIAYFSASCLGATVVPLDRQWRPEEVARIADFVEAKAALVGDNLVQPIQDAFQRAKVFCPVLAFSQLAQPQEETPLSQSSDEGLLAEPIDSESVASIIFVTGPTVEPRGAMLTHRNFLSNLRAIVKVLPPMQNDHCLSVLPLHHAFAFTGELLVTLWAGATITYPENLRSRTVLETMKEVGVTALIGVPRVFQILHEAIHAEVRRQGKGAWFLFNALKLISRWWLALTGHNLGRRLFAPVHQRFGGKLRLLVSGGAALPPSVFDDFTAMGFLLCEGYGLTEASPVVTVNPPTRPKRGSVGKPLPGVEVVIAHPDERGIGEVLVRGPNVFAGYFRNPLATERVLRNGWLYTGDLGCFDRDGYLYITGRLKEVIVTAAGKNVYPEEVEQKLAGIAGVKELCVVGMWDEETMGERPHLVVVPEPDWMETPERLQQFEAHVRREVQQRSASLASYQRIAQVHILTEELPKTVALAPDRAAVRAMLMAKGKRSEQVSAAPPMLGKSASPEVPEPLMEQVVTLLSHLTNQPKDRITAATRLEELGVDSLLQVELIALLESRFRVSLPEGAIASAQTVGEIVEFLTERLGGSVPEAPLPENGSALVITRLITPETKQEAQRWLRETTFQKWARRQMQRWLSWSYRRWFSLEVAGLEHLPQNGPFIIAANHASHMDTGAILVALGERMQNLFVLGARDYFFNSWWRGWFFHTFLRVVPFDRTVNPLEGLRLAAAILNEGYSLLIFPEGTRSVTGKLQPFKPGLGMLAVETGVPIVPALIEGTFEALPKGRLLPKPHPIRVTFGEPVRVELIVSANSRSAERRTLYQQVTDAVRQRIEALMNR